MARKNDELRMLLAAAPSGSETERALRAELTLHAQETQELTASPVPRIDSGAAVQAAAAQRVDVLSTSTPAPVTAGESAQTAAEVEALSGGTVTVEEAQAYGLTTEEMLALAALRNEDDTGSYAYTTAAEYDRLLNLGLR